MKWNHFISETAHLVFQHSFGKGFCYNNLRIHLKKGTLVDKPFVHPQVTLRLRLSYTFFFLISTPLHLSCLSLTILKHHEEPLFFFLIDLLSTYSTCQLWLVQRGCLSNFQMQQKRHRLFNTLFHLFTAHFSSILTAITSAVSYVSKCQFGKSVYPTRDMLYQFSSPRDHIPTPFQQNQKKPFWCS